MCDSRAGIRDCVAPSSNSLPGYQANLYAGASRVSYVGRKLQQYMNLGFQLSALPARAMLAEPPLSEAGESEGEAPPPCRATSTGLAKTLFRHRGPWLSDSESL